jgi:Holliday junction resolvase
MESKLQSEIIKYLKSKGCFVVKLQAGPGVPQGSPDILALKEGCWLAIEVKASVNSPFQPLQKERLAKLDEWSWARAVYPQNWPEIKAELDSLLAD